MVEIHALDSFNLEAITNKYYPFLLEVRKRVFFILAFFAVGMVGGFFFYEPIIRFLLGVLSLKGVNIVFTSPFQFINLALSTGLMAGLTISFPLILTQLLSFLRPALRTREYKALLSFVPFSIILFITGFAFGVIIMKWQIEIFLTRSSSLGIGNILDVSHLLSVVLVTSALMGVGFEFPLLLLALLKTHVLKHDQLTAQRPWVYLGSFIFALLLPPDSVLADIILTLPLVILFEITLILDRVLARHKGA